MMSTITMPMDTSFYEERIRPGRGGSIQDMKSKMTLNFDSMSQQKAKNSKFAALLASPDLNMLKLASPELEKMIIQSQNGMVTTTPTPTQFVYPRTVTEEQEAYARGFVDALAELHSTTGPTEGDDCMDLDAVTSITTSSGFTNTTTGPSTQALSTITTTSLPGSSFMTSRPASIPRPTHTSVLRLKEEPQTVPCLLNTPPMSPINMESQEVIKLERKRARNRVAARKCRTRKLERISRLEDRVSDLKTVNSTLTVSSKTLRDEVSKLKQQIMEHVNSGCQVMMSQNLL